MGNMAILLGVDTGGTYTDAVLMEDNKNIIASSKALTTKHDLSIGIGEAVQAVLAKSTKKTLRNRHGIFINNSGDKCTSGGAR